MALEETQYLSWSVSAICNKSSILRRSFSRIAHGRNKVNETMFFPFHIECDILSIQLLSVELVIVCLVYSAQMEVQGCSQEDRRN